jgi:hypothetical protein
MRRCILSFNQLMFHDLQKLYEAFNYYKQGQVYSFRQAKMQMDKWAEEKVAGIENEVVVKRYEEVKEEIARVNGPKFYKKHLLNAVNECLARKDLEAISNMHKYFDYNLNFIDLHGSKPIHPVKVH